MNGTFSLFVTCQNKYGDGNNELKNFRSGKPEEMPG